MVGFGFIFYPLFGVANRSLHQSSLTTSTSCDSNREGYAYPAEEPEEDSDEEDNDVDDDDRSVNWAVDEVSYRIESLFRMIL